MDATKMVRYEFTKDDFIAFNLYHQQNSPSLRGQRRHAFIVLLLAGVLLAAVPFLVRRTQVLWGASAILIMIACFVPSSAERTVRKVVDKMLDEGRNKGLLGLKEISLTPAEISSKGALRSGTTGWPAVEKIVTTDEALYIYISAIEAIVVPRRAFGTPAEFEDFAATARRYHTEAAGRSK